MEGDYHKTKSFWSFITNKISPVALAIVIVAFLVLGGATLGYVVYSQRTILALSQQNLNSQNNHHTSNVKTQAQLQEALNEANAALVVVKQSAAVIEYEGGVIAFQNGEIIAAQQAGHATLNAITALEGQLSGAESSVGGALVTGQAQINAYLNYLTCLTTNMSNQVVCGAAPPLPPTTPSNAS